MTDRTLFVIPIYLRSLEKHALEMEKRKKKYIEFYMSKTYHLDSNEYAEMFDRIYRIPWKNSQIVGFIEVQISIFGDLKAYYWFVKAKRLTDKLKDRTMEDCGKLLDVSKLTKSNENICKDIRKFISYLPSLRRRFKNRYFDTEHLETILDAIDFSKIDYYHKQAYINSKK